MSDNIINIDIEWFVALSKKIDNLVDDLNNLKQQQEDLKTLQIYQIEEIHNLKDTLNYVSPNFNLLSTKIQTVDAKINDVHIALANSDDKIQNIDNSIANINDQIQTIQEMYMAKEKPSQYSGIILE